MLSPIGCLCVSVSPAALPFDAGYSCSRQLNRVCCPSLCKRKQFIYRTVAEQGASFLDPDMSGSVSKDQGLGACLARRRHDGRAMREGSPANVATGGASPRVRRPHGTMAQAETEHLETACCKRTHSTGHVGWHRGEGPWVPEIWSSSCLRAELAKRASTPPPSSPP